MNFRCLALLILTLFVTSTTMAVPVWQAGSARIKLTPEQFMWMSGYGGRTVPADGKLTDIWAKAVVLHGSGNDAVLITADLIGIGGESTEWIAGELKESRFGTIAIRDCHCTRTPDLRCRIT